MRGSRKVCISIKNLKCHEFHTTIRKLHRDNNTWSGRFEVLSGIETQATKQFIQMFAQNVVAYLILTSLRAGNMLEIKVISFEASIPASYFMAASSFLLLLTAISLCHLSVAMSLKARESGKLLLPGFSASIFSLIVRKENGLSLGITMFSNYFVKEVIPISSFLASGILLGLFSMVLPLFAFGYYLFNHQLDIIFSNDILMIERVASCSGLALCILSLLYAVLFHLPLPCKKDTKSIRWNFLYLLPYEGPHPLVEKWTGER